MIAHQAHQRKILVVSFDATRQMQLQVQQIIEQHQQQLLQLLLRWHHYLLQLDIEEGWIITVSLSSFLALHS